MVTGVWIALATMAAYTLVVLAVTRVMTWSADRADAADPVDGHAESAAALMSPDPLPDADLSADEQELFDEALRGFYSPDAFPAHYWPPVVPGPEETR